MPEQEELLFGPGGEGADEEDKEDKEEVQPFPYAWETFEAGRGDEVCIFHTLGSTGPPKTVAYMHEMLVRVMGQVGELSEQSRRPRLQGEVQEG